MVKVKVKADIALHGNPISELRDVTCHMGSHSVTCHPTQVNAPRLTSVIQAGSRFTYPWGMEGWVDLVDLMAPQPGVKPATFRSRVRCRTAAPPRQDGLTRSRRTTPYHLEISGSVMLVMVTMYGVTLWPLPAKRWQLWQQQQQEHPVHHSPVTLFSIIYSKTQIMIKIWH